MSIDHGRSPSEPGYSAEPEPKEVSAVPVSIPNAVTISGELYAFLMGEAPMEGVWFGDLNDGLPGRFWWRGLLRCAAGWPTVEEQDPDALTGCSDDQIWADVPVEALRHAIEARSGETGPISLTGENGSGSTEGESAVGNAETPKPLGSTNPNTERQSL